MKYTSEVFKRLSSGKFLSANSIETEAKALYNDVADSFEEYHDYFEMIDFNLEVGNNCYYFTRTEGKVMMEQKLKTFYNWIDYVDFLKTYANNFGSGTQFKLGEIEARLTSDVELKEKLEALSTEKESYRDKLVDIAKQLTEQGFAEQINVVDGTYQVTDAFNYLESVIMAININEEVENEISE